MFFQTSIFVNNETTNVIETHMRRNDFKVIEKKHTAVSILKEEN